MGRIGTIINRKGKQDAKKSKEFTKLGRYLMVAAREGGSDPEYNAQLATAIEKAKAQNMPNDNIERAIKKGAGELEGIEYVELTYEGYGPGGIAFVVECLTDNTNRTASDVRSYFTKAGGSLGKSGGVTYMFDHKGVLAIDKADELEQDVVEMDIIESGAEDFSVEEDYYEILTDLTDFAQVRDALRKKGYVFSMAELRYLPQNTLKLSNEDDIKNINKLIDLFDENDDVQNIYHNWDDSDLNQA